jgi:hypothetical protein
MHLQPVFKGCDSFLNGTSDNLFSTGLCLPSGSNLDFGDIERVSNVILKSL